MKNINFPHTQWRAKASKYPPYSPPYLTKKLADKSEHTDEQQNNPSSDEPRWVRNRNLLSKVFIVWVMLVIFMLLNVFHVVNVF